jgi:hypothetical protein
MPIKKLRVAFDIDVNVLAAALASHNCGMHVQLAGEAMPEELEPPKRQLALPAPKRGENLDIVVAYISAHRDRTVRMDELRKILPEKSLSNALFRARSRGLIRKVGIGQYRISVKGRSYGG